MEKPASSIATTLGSAAINAAGDHIGLYPTVASPSGITFTGNVNMPADLLQAQGQGAWNWVQVGAWERERVLASNGQKQKLDGNGIWYLDFTYPYEPAPYTSHPGNAGSYVTGTPHTDMDEPETPLEPYITKKSVNAEPSCMYLMFLPPGEDSRYVPLRAVSWIWSIAVTRIGTVWTVDTGSVYQFVSPSFEITSHPQWTGNVRDHRNWINEP